MQAHIRIHIYSKHFGKFRGGKFPNYLYKGLLIFRSNMRCALLHLCKF